MNTTTHHYAPTLDEVQQLAAKADRTANLVAICSESDAGDETPTTAFLKIRRRSNSSETTNKEKDDNLAFIFELSEKNNPIVLRHSIVSAEPWKVMRTGPGLEHHGDPLVHLERELANHKVTSPFHRARRTQPHTHATAHARTVRSNV
jgi:anthranilate synthase component 1